MAQARTAIRPYAAVSRMWTKTAGVTTRNIRVTVTLCVVLICGSFAAAAVLLTTQRGFLPLYMYLIFGPALCGAWLAVIFVHEFERRAKATESVRALLATPSADAKLLIRLADAERRAVEAERSKSEFIAHMSHEMRTPLNAVIGFSEVIEQGFFGSVGHPKYVEYARDIGAAGRDLHGKIGDILEFANVEAGRFPVTPGRIELAEIAGNCVNEFAGRAFSRRITLDMAVSPETQAVGDALAVQRILGNLLSNALNYTPEGGHVRVDVRSDAGAAVVRVRDTGYGFSQAEARQVGEAFARFDRPGAVTGTGLGLAIAMSLARRMGGAVRLGGAPGRGTSAELRLRRP
jgi:two-component system cell cycle sensor histidine kinase PleC